MSLEPAPAPPNDAGVRESKPGTKSAAAPAGNGTTKLLPLGYDETGTHGDCVAAAREHLGEPAALVVGSKADDIREHLAGRFDCYAAALAEIASRLKRGVDVQNFHALALFIGKSYARGGITAPGSTTLAATGAAPVKLTPAQEKRRRQDEAMRIVTEELIAEEKARNGRRGAE